MYLHFVAYFVTVKAFLVTDTLYLPRSNQAGSTFTNDKFHSTDDACNTIFWKVGDRISDADMPLRPQHTYDTSILSYDATMMPDGRIKFRCMDAVKDGGRPHGETRGAYSWWYLKCGPDLATVTAEYNAAEATLNAIKAAALAATKAAEEAARPTPTIADRRRKPKAQKPSHEVYMQQVKEYNEKMARRTIAMRKAKSAFVLPGGPLHVDDILMNGNRGFCVTANTLKTAPSMAPQIGIGCWDNTVPDDAGTIYAWREGPNHGLNDPSMSSISLWIANAHEGRGSRRSTEVAYGVHNLAYRVQPVHRGRRLRLCMAYDFKYREEVTYRMMMDSEHAYIDPNPDDYDYPEELEEELEELEEQERMEKEWVDADHDPDFFPDYQDNYGAYGGFGTATGPPAPATTTQTI